MCSKTGTSWTLVFGTTCWILWRWHNKTLFEDEFLKVTNPIDFICFKVQQFHQIMGTENMVNSIPIEQWRLIGWSVPAKGWVKVNSDDAMKHDSSLATGGGVLTGENGRWISGFCYSFGLLFFGVGKDMGSLVWTKDGLG